MTVRRTPWLPAAVVLLAWAVRVIGLDRVPPGLSQDEVLNADIALFIRQGRHALFFREGYGHEPLFHYWTVPFQTLLGDNWFSIRLPAAVLGTLLVALTISWLWRKQSQRVALGAGLLLALSWWPVIFSRIGIRPIILPLFLVGVAWLWEKRRVMAAGILLGLAMYTYTAARVMLLLPLAMLLYDAAGWWRKERAGSLTAALRPAALFGGSALLIFLPLQLYLWSDPTLQQRVDQLAGPLTALRQGDWGPVVESVLRTVGVFSFVGDPRWTYTVPDVPLFDPLTAFFFFAGFGSISIGAVRRRDDFFMLAWFGFGLLPSALTPQSPSIIRLIAIIPLVYFWAPLGLERLAAVFEKRFGRRAVATAATVILAVLLAAAGWRSWTIGFNQWPRALETRIRYGSVWQAIGRAWAETPAIAPVISDAWVDPIDQDSLRRDLGREIPARWVQTGEGVVSGALILPAVPPARLYVPEYAPPAADLMTALGLVEPLFRRDTTPGFAVYDLPLEPAIPSLVEPVSFAHSLTLLGWSWAAGGESPDPEPGEAMALLTFWRVEAPLPADLSIFLHFSGADGAPLTQHDGLDVLLSQLQPGDRILQRHTLTLPADLSPGAYHLRLGLYERNSGRRWPQSADGGDAVIIENFEFDGRRLNR